MRTTTSRATGETPFVLVYGAEAVLPSEIQLGSTRIDLQDLVNQGELREDDGNMLEERCDQALSKSATYLQGLRRNYNRRVRPRTLHVGDLVLRRIQNQANLYKLSSR